MTRPPHARMRNRRPPGSYSRLPTQAAATLAAAELQAAKIRAGILKLSADLGGVATNFTEGLLSPAKPATKPATKPPARPAARPATRSVAAPATKPGVSPRRTKPGTQAPGKAKNRQVSAARK
jgi:hypothetical protein